MFNPALPQESSLPRRERMSKHTLTRQTSCVVLSWGRIGVTFLSHWTF